MHEYNSLFAKVGIISKLELCEMLGLNTARTSLTFTTSEIHRAFRRRALRLHPDKQSVQKIKIPAEFCGILMHDVMRARDHLLKGEENIPGSGIDKSITSRVLRTTVSRMSQFNPTTLADNIKWVAWLSTFPLSTIPLSILFSMFTSDNQLYIRYVSLLSKNRSLLQLFDPKFVTSLLQAVKHIGMAIESPETQTWLRELKNMAAIQPFLNELLGALTDPALPTVLQYYKPLLEDDVIEALQNIAASTHQLLLDIPSYSHIIGTYLSCMIFTTDRLLKIIAVYRDLAYVINEQKNPLDAMKIYFSLFVLSIVILPLNIVASIINAEIRSKLIFFASGYVFAYHAFMLALALKSVLSDMRENGPMQYNFGQLLKNLVTFAWDISARYPFEITTGAIDNLIYWLGWQRVLQPKLNEATDYLDELHKYWFPKPIPAVPVNHQEEQDLLMTIADSQHTEQRPGAAFPDTHPAEQRLTVASDRHHTEYMPPVDEQPVPEALSPFLSENDIWLENILKLVQKHNAANGLNTAPVQSPSTSSHFFRLESSEGLEARDSVTHRTQP